MFSYEELPKDNSTRAHFLLMRNSKMRMSMDNSSFNNTERKFDGSVIIGT